MLTVPFAISVGAGLDQEPRVLFPRFTVGIVALARTRGASIRNKPMVSTFGRSELLDRIGEGTE